MRPQFDIVEGRHFHCGQMSRLLRTEQHRAMCLLGAPVHRDLRKSFEASSFRRAWLIDGRLAGLGGVMGTALDSDGIVWLALSNEAMRYPVQVVKEARRQLAIVMITKRVLATSILADDATSRRFAVFLGFRPMTNESLPLAYSSKGRRDLDRFIVSSPELRKPIGPGYIIGMTYREAA